MITFILLIMISNVLHKSQTDIPEYFDIPNDEITLVWEHSCIKHLQKGEIQRARQVKETIDWQRAKKKYVTVNKEDFLEAKKYLAEAKLAKEKMGDAWKCNPVPEKLRIVGLKIGRDNNDAMPPETFVSNNAQNIAIEGKVEILENCRECRVEWKSSFPKNEANAVTLTNQTDVKYLHSLAPAPQADRGDVFKAIVSAALFGGDGKLDEVSYAVQQDEQDQLRQEYVDMEKKIVPKREELLDTLHPLEHGIHGSLEMFNASARVGGGKYQYILFEIFDRWQALKAKLGKLPTKVNSGYRNPYKHHVILGAKTKNSSHMYGRAVDILLEDFNQDGKVNDNDRPIINIPAKSLGACIEPAEKTPTWIHLDWRGSCPAGW